jgi:Zn-finger nucleic acid-binding protein
MTEAPTFNCSVCGAPARAGDSSCRFCGAGIATVRCSRCFQMNMSDAHRCAGCGAELGLILESELLGQHCSECGEALELMREPSGSLLACRRCGGQFVEHALLRSLIEQYETTALAFPDAPYHRPVPKAVLERVHYRPCSLCQQMMNRKNFGGSSGVIVDVCAKHGTWFDAGELPQILEFVKSGGLVRERLREAERKRQALAHDRERMETDGAPHSLDTLSLPAHSAPHSSFAADLFQFIVEVLKRD